VLLHVNPSARARRRCGGVAVLVASVLTVLVGILAFAVDGGLLLDNKRQVQAAADAAALAAATQLFYHYPAIEASNYTTYDPGGAAYGAAVSSAANNGYSNNGVTSSVTVNIPPQSGPFAGKVSYAEVIITYYQTRYFSSIWGNSTLPVSARAVARGRWAGSGVGVLLLDPSAKESLDSSGGASASVTGGASVVVDSSDTTAAAVTGGGAFTASAFNITGGYTGPLDGTITTGVPPTPDPLRYLPVPTEPPAGTMTTVNLGNGNKQYTLSPGTYDNLPNFNSGDVVILQQASAGNGGIFYINGGGFSSQGANIIMDSTTTGGVMIYNNPSSNANSEGINITGNSSGTVDLSPLTSGPYAGMLMFQNRTAGQTMSISGGGSFSLNGTFYAANALLKITGGGDATIGSQYISRQLNLGGNGAITINYTDNGTARLREVLLVE
jgi:hypothetical protein